jgi:hypothetical protein
MTIKSLRNTMRVVHHESTDDDLTLIIHITRSRRYWWGITAKQPKYPGPANPADLVEVEVANADRFYSSQADCLTDARIHAQSIEGVLV